MEFFRGLGRSPKKVVAACCVVLVAGVVVLRVLKLRGTAPRPRGTPVALSCTSTFDSSAAVEAAVASAARGAVECLSSGTYSGLVLRRRADGDVTVQPAPGERVTIASGAIDGHRQSVAVVIAPGARDIVLRGFHITSEVELEPGDASIRIDHNDISGGPYGIQLDSSDCQTPNAPTWTGCRPSAKITDTTISGNHIHHIVGREDALNIDNFAGLRITGNEIDDVIEGGHHTDCLQSTFGGSNLVFDHNYEHDNECQGFFVKDGDVVGMAVENNLFVRDDLPALLGGSAAGSSQIFNTAHLVVERNTVWDSKGLTLRCVNSSVRCSATIDDNVFASLTNGSSGDAHVFLLREAQNSFGRRPWSFGQAASDVVLGTAVTIGTSAGRVPSGVGVDWNPARQHYGP